MAYILLILNLILSSQNSFASSCCGQSPASFSVLSLEQKLSLTTAYSLIQSQGRVYNNSDEFFVWSDKKRQVEALQVNLASSINSKQQVFLNTSILKGHYTDNLENEGSQHLSDTQVGYTYEILPEYSFSYWKPVVYLSILINAPTGKSIYDNTKLSEGADVTGYNQWGSGLGLTLRKVYFPLTITFQTKVLKIFSKQFDEAKVSDFYDSSIALLTNYVTPYWEISLNLGLTYNHLSKKTIQPTNTTSGTVQSTSALIGIQRSFGEKWSGGLNYADQTLLGKAKNTVLNKTYSLNINYNYF